MFAVNLKPSDDAKEMFYDAMSTFTDSKEEMIDKIDEIMHKGVSVKHDISDESKEFISTTAQQLKDIVKSFSKDGVAVNVNNPLSTYTDKIRELATTYGIPALVIGVGLAFWYVRGVGKKDRIDTKVIFQMLPPSMASVVAEPMQHILNHENEIHSQGPIEITDSLLNLLGGAISIGVVGLSAVYAKGTVVDQVKYVFKDIPRTCDSIIWVFKTLFTLVEQAINYIGNKLGYGDLLVMRTKSADINDWMTAVTNLAGRIEQNQEQLTPMVADEFHALVTTGNDLIKKYGNDRELNTRIIKCRDLLEHHRQAFSGLNFSDSGFRINPMTINLRGSAGKGKSTSAVLLSKALCQITLPDHLLPAYEKSPHSQIFCVQSENVFWDGYQNQWVSVFDDFLQMKDNDVNMDNEVMKFMRAAQDFPMHLHMSSISMKSDTYFRSRIILMTTNAMSYNNQYVKSINQIDALNRRIDVDVEFCIKAEYATPETCNDPHGSRILDPIYTKDGLNTDIWSYKVTRLRGRPVLCPEMGFEDFLEYCSGEFRETQNRSVALALSSKEELTKTQALRNKFKAGEHDTTAQESVRRKFGVVAHAPKKEVVVAEDGLYNTRRASTNDLAELKLYLQQVYETRPFLRKNCKTNIWFNASLDGEDKELLYQHMSLTPWELQHGVKKSDFTYFECEAASFKTRAQVLQIEESIRWGIPDVILSDDSFIMRFDDGSACNLLENPDYLIARMFEFYSRYDSEVYFTKDIEALLVDYPALRESESFRRKMWYLLESFDECNKICQAKHLGSYIDLIRSKNFYKVQKLGERKVIKGSRACHFPWLFTEDENYSPDTVIHLEYPPGIFIPSVERAKAIRKGSYKRDPINWKDLLDPEFSLHFRHLGQYVEDKLKWLRDKLGLWESFHTSAFAVLKFAGMALWAAAMFTGACALGTALGEGIKYVLNKITGSDKDMEAQAMVAVTSKPGEVIEPIGAAPCMIPIVRIDSQPVAQSPERDDQRNVKKPKAIVSKRGNNRSHMNKAQVQSQMLSDPSCDDIARVVRRNVYKLVIGPVDAGYVLALGGQEFLMPYHYYTYWKAKGIVKPDTLINIVNADDRTEIWHVVPGSYILDAKRLAGGIRDLCIFTTPLNLVPPMPDLTKKWLTLEQLNTPRSWTVRLELYRSNYSNAYITDGLIEGRVDVLGANDETYYVNDMISYCIPTKVGDCGLPCFVMDKRTGGRKICGVHVAGNGDGLGFSTLIGIEEIMDVLNTFPNRIVPPTIPNEVPDVVCAQGNFKPLAKTTYPVFSPSETRVRRSELYNTYKTSGYAPGVLKKIKKSDGLIYDPYFISLEKYGRQQVYIEPRIFDAALDNWTAFFVGMTKNAKFRRLLTFEEACEGIIGETFLDGLSRKTSAGYPWGRKAQGKYTYFGSENKFQFNSQACKELRESVEAIIKKAENREATFHVYLDVLKDERRKLAKVESCSTRFVSASPIDLTIANRIYYMACTKAMQDYRITNGIAVGMNVYSDEWNTLAYHLSTKGPAVFDADFKGFDGSQSLMFTSISNHIAKIWYAGSEIENNVRDTLDVDMRSSCHTRDGNIYRWNACNPSGTPLTTFVNGNTVHVFLRIAWVDIHDGDIHSLKHFNTHVYLIVFGDDHVVNVSDAYKDRFNVVTISAIAPKYGFVYTSAAKTDITEPYTTIDKVTFLKRSFKWDHVLQRYVAPLELDVVLEMPFWRMDSSDPHGMTKVIIETAFMELSIHGPQTFYEWFPKMRQALMDKLRIAPERSSWEAYYEIALNCKETWGMSPRKTQENIETEHIRVTNWQHSQASVSHSVVGTSFDEDGSIKTYYSGSSEGSPLKTQSTGALSALDRYTRGDTNLPATKQIIEGFVDLIDTVKIMGQSPSYEPSYKHTKQTVVVPRSSHPSTSSQMYGKPGAQMNTSDNTRSLVEDKSDPTTGTTNIETNAVSIETTFESLDLGAELRSTASTEYTQGIVEFLAKPVRIGAGTFSAANALPPSTAMFSLQLDYNNFLSQYPIWKNKLAGFYAIRATVEVRLVINANPFQQGRLILSFVPMADSGRDFSRNNSLTQLTQLPHIQIDIACDTAATLKIPYVQLQTHLDMINNKGDWGTLWLYPYLPFNYGTGSSSCNWEIWANLTDVELVTPAIANLPTIVAQMATGKKRKPRKKKVDFAQVPKNSPQDVEQANTDGTVTQWMKGAESLANDLAEIPLLSTVAKPVAWAAGIASDICSFFGWSKPNNMETLHRVNRTIYQGQLNADAVEQGYSLGLMQTNQTSIMPEAAGTLIDEMSIDYLKQIYTYTDSFNWSTTSTDGSVLFSKDLKPINISNQVTIGTYTYTSPSPACYIAGMFRYWRGSFKIRFKIAKTMFHSGRLIFSFSPGFGNDSDGSPRPTIAPASNQDTDYIHREFMDIRTGNEYEFLIPFVSVVPYLQTLQSMGMVQIRILNPLVAPDTVAQSIDFAVEMALCGDAEFFWPSRPLFQPTDPSVYRPAITAQMNSESRADCMNITNTPIGGSAVRDMCQDFAECCVGEQIRSLRQLLFRSSYDPYDITPSEFGVFRPFGVWPFTSSDVIMSAGFNDYISTISPMFKISRGSVVVRYYDNSTLTNRTASLALTHNNTDAMSPDYIASAYFPMVTEDINANILAVRVPQYSTTFGRLVALDTELALGAQYPYRSAAALYIMQGGASPTTINFKLSRSVADDFQLSCFVGVPLCFVSAKLQ